jgi:hypothetical protein
MSSRGKSWSKAKAVCPRPEHAGSRVRFDGQYGPARHRRQYYKCVPSNGDRPHRFTEVLPREESWKDACELCERDVDFHEGPHAAHKYQFVARGIAETLVAVGAGATYRHAALRRGSYATTTAASRPPSGPASPTPGCTCASGTCATHWSA